MKKAFSVFVFGNYDRFLPYYVYSIEKVYPGSDVLIFYNSKLSSKVREYLSNKSFVKVYEDFYQEYNFFENYKIRGGGKKLLRHVIPFEYFKEYEYVYFGDVDIIHLKEDESLFDFHINQAKISKVPFSNKVRPLADGGLSKRLTGLHFIITKPYYEKVGRVIHKIMNDESYRQQIIEKVSRDEEFLYQINLEAHNFDPIPLSNNSTPLHGLHLGVFRTGSKPSEVPQGYIVNHEDMVTQLQKMLNDKDFKVIINNFYCKEFYYTLLFFNIKPPFKLKLLFYNEKLKQKLNKIPRSIYKRINGEKS